MTESPQAFFLSAGPEGYATWLTVSEQENCSHPLSGCSKETLGSKLLK